MKKYQVGFWYTEYGTAFIEAKSKKEAEAKVYDTLQDDGTEELKWRCNDRDYGTCDAEEVDKKQAPDQN